MEQVIASRWKRGNLPGSFISRFPTLFSWAERTLQFSSEDDLEMTTNGKVR
jgi:hypothetical protein